MKFTLVAIVSFLACANFANAADVLILTSGQVVFGKIHHFDNTGLKFQRGSSTYTYPNATVVKTYESRDNSNATASFVLPTWGKTLANLYGRPWIGTVKQIPATVVDKGVLKNVPYMSFRCGIDYEINIYTLSGDIVRKIPKTDIQLSVDRSADRKWVYEYIWDLKNGDGTDIAPGVYLYLVRADGEKKSSKAVIIR